MMKRTGMIVAIILALALGSAPLAFARDTDEAKTEAQKRTGQMTDGKKQLAPNQPGEEKAKEQAKTKVPAISPIDTYDRQKKSAAEMKPAQPQQTQPMSASAVRDKGRQIKWQILCSGANCGANRSSYGGAIDLAAVFVCGSLGQLAVGQGNSPSFGVNQGFWQGFLSGYVRGDCNDDGVVGPADVVYLLNYLFRNGPPPDPLWVGDCNSNEAVGPADVVFLINYLFRGGPPPIG